MGLAALAALFCLTSASLHAQAGGGAGGGAAGGGGGGGGRGNFDPAQFRQRQMDRYKELLEVTSDDEWKVIGERVGAVVDAQREANAGRRGMGGRRNQNNGGQAAAGGNRGGRGGTPSPEAEALQKAIDDKASSDVIKAALAKYRDAHTAKQAKLATAQDELRKVLSVRQEGQAVLAGLLN